MLNEDKMDRTLLLVDDEENILSSLTRLFRKSGYNIIRANSGQQGLEMVKKHSVGVIVSDQRMPEMQGIEFLSKVKLTHPDTIRMILSGYTDLKSITDAINEGAVYKFLTKPWDDDLLLKNVAEAFELYEMKLVNAWLAEELDSTIDSLENANKELNQDVEQKTVEADLNMHILRIAQEVLENMPAGIIGIDDHGLVAITNKLTEEWIADGSESVIGSMAKDSLPNSIFDLYQSVLKNNDERVENITFPNGLKLDVRCSKLGTNSDSGGTILVLTKSL